MSTLEEWDMEEAYHNNNVVSRRIDYTKSNREQELEDTLRNLLTKHFFSTKFEWNYSDGVTLLDGDVSLYAKIVTLLPGILEDMR